MWGKISFVTFKSPYLLFIADKRKFQFVYFCDVLLLLGSYIVHVIELRRVAT